MKKSAGEKKKPCKNCEGKGTLKKGDKIVRCQRCGGTGIKPSQLTMQTLRATYDTNFFGVFAVTQAMLPLLRKSTSARIINQSQTHGRNSWPMRVDATDFECNASRGCLW